MAKAYLTIDDSPTEDSLKLCAFLKDRNIPALFYCRGDQIEKHKIIAIEMIKQGFVLGNHGYAHKRAIDLSTADVKQDILRCEALLDEVYQAANVARPGKYYRFPYLDRGCGAWIIDYDGLASEDQSIITRLFAEGLYLDDARPSTELLEKRASLQSFLKDQGFTLPFKNVSFPWYINAAMDQAYDALYTFSTADWMLTKRHLKKNHPFKSVDDLKQKIDDDAFLWNGQAHNIILAHDQAELTDHVIALSAHMHDKGLEFLPPEPS